MQEVQLFRVRDVSASYDGVPSFDVVRRDADGKWQCSQEVWDTADEAFAAGDEELLHPSFEFWYRADYAIDDHAVKPFLVARANT